MDESCPAAWSATQQVLGSAGSLGGIVCNDTASRLGELSGCCSGVNIVIPGTGPVAEYPFLTYLPGSLGGSTLGLLGPAILSFVGRLYNYVYTSVAENLGWQRVSPPPPPPRQPLVG